MVINQSHVPALDRRNGPPSTYPSIARHKVCRLEPNLDAVRADPHLLPRRALGPRLPVPDRGYVGEAEGRVGEIDGTPQAALPRPGWLHAPVVMAQRGWAACLDCFGNCAQRAAGGAGWCVPGRAEAGAVVMAERRVVAGWIAFRGVEGSLGPPFAARTAGAANNVNVRAGRA